MTATAPTVERPHVRRAEDELLAELRGLCERLPVPGADWHPHVAAIAACRDDLADAIEAVAARPAARARLEALLADEAEPAFDHTAADPGTAAAYERLRALPVPEGQHPFLAEILPALEALELLLVALAAAGD